MSKILITFLCAVLFVQTAKAQDANYWSSGYNPAGYLTPGAVVAFNRDSGVMFLNPALLSHNTKSSASISGTVYQYGDIKIKNGAGTGYDLNSTSASIIPQMVSAVIAIKGNHPFTLGYALTHTPVMSFQATQQRDATFNVLNDSYSPGPEVYLGQYKNINTTNETSGIISGGFKISNDFSFGLSAEGDLRKQSYNTDISSRALYNSSSDEEGLPPIATTLESYLASYYNVGIRFKAGLAYDADRSHVGITVSSPLLHIAGSASLLSDQQVSDLIIGPKDTLNLLANTRQQSLKVKYKMPLSTAFGYAYDFDKGQIYFAAEYFTKVNEYDIITPRNATFIKGEPPSDYNGTEVLQFEDARKSILNYGIGASYMIKPEVTGFISLHTDYNYADNSLYKDVGNGYTSNTAYYNIYHCQIGANIKKRKFNFRAGLLLSYGTTDKYMQTVNFSNPNEGNTLLGDPGNTKASYFGAGLLLSYIHNL
ncbi:hypothetical protein SAMN05216490_4827 [Mucilaginibacter mallensis]|uniref:Long-chain fatty acid transport protein n=1 Tax=Mucilaginibacter mallensis TaxID=652787 RepID=A0A1H2CBY4_MUCMA|nr:hypothetical protein [Mucilaginibacter mallensis]SDT67747.1 hypothetical protein SAMN05216490_4827 [Mucilaginibacter mallensis]